MISIKNYFIFIIASLFISCGGDDTSTGADGQEFNFDGAQLLMAMSDDLTLTISVKNFSAVNQIKFDLVFNFGNFSVSSSEKSGTIDAMEEMLDEENNRLSYLFTSNISGDADLVTIQFASNNYDSEVFRPENILIYDSQGSPLYYKCSNTTYADPIACRNNNEVWKIDRDTFHYQTICYINEHPTNGEMIGNGEYRWTNTFCDGIPATWE